MTELVNASHKARGRNCSLPPSTFDLEGNAPATSGRSDHPRLHGWLLHKDASLLPVGPDCIPSDPKRLMPVVSHVAGLQGRVVDHISVSLRNLVQEVDRVFHARYFPHKVLPFLQIDRAIKHLRDHSYLTENVGDQQGWRVYPAPAIDLFSRFSGFKTGCARDRDFFLRRLA